MEVTLYHGIAQELGDLLTARTQSRNSGGDETQLQLNLVNCPNNSTLQVLKLRFISQKVLWTGCSTGELQLPNLSLQFYSQL